MNPLRPLIIRVHRQIFAGQRRFQNGGSGSLRRSTNVKAVQRMHGHAKAAMTPDVYAGLFDEDLDDVADRFGAAI
jgi:hypothetical protein